MATIPEEFKRVVEAEVDKILERHLTSSTPLASWIFRKAFVGSALVSVQRVRLHRHKDYRKRTGNSLAHGETDVEVVATIEREQKQHRVAILIENKVDAGQMPDQGLRYQARANCERDAGSWTEFRCLLIGPRSYLEAQYLLGGFRDDGWDDTLSYEEVATILRTNNSSDAATLITATAPANSWNKPIPSAVQFWKDYGIFQRAFHPTIPVFVKTQKGSRAGGVWPSFYDNQLRYNLREPRRKRVQLVHMDTNAYVTLFIKRVAYADFVHTAEGLLEEGMSFAPPGGSWQSIRLGVPGIDVCKPLDHQTEQLDEVFKAAKRLYEFYLRHERNLLAIPVVTKGS